ncbi:bacterial transcriptional activator domain-containing protein [Paenarthrobacter sp. DKR-5]|uniref:AfsR/SARP family transcriptional regulator n=1 Tax=Paenarthrobacter sp. DKR-5 TaxID=2835535 RepID=UPI001BDC5AD7|nr:bacterial transcriptional activator domain-containing protein [Paenarthrobacter sp. DKR-5]MBT1003874.1 bacterial transcriptional activator domain-containing protein [Paenarthrobacter sp. DKR-5]
MLTADGQPALTGVRQQRLITTLAIGGDRSRSALASLLWPQTRSALALANLRAAVFRVGGDQPGLVESHGTMLGLSASVETDLARVRGLIHEVKQGVRVPTSREIDALLRADLLLGWYEDWVLFEQDRLLQDRVAALECAAEHCLKIGDLDRAIVAAEGAAALEPLREAPHRTIVRAHLAAGRRQEAARRARHFEATIRAQLGTAPGPRFTNLLNAGP